MLFQAQLRDLLERSLPRLTRVERVLGRVDLEEVTIPDSNVVRDAERHAAESYSPPLLLHCYRTYFWGALLGQGDGLLSFDPELLFVASILHDLGISEHNLPRTHVYCFATTGAREAAELVRAGGWDEERATRTYEAISLHLNPLIDASVQGAEARLVGDGATMDVLGSRHHRVPVEAIRRVHARHPRNGFREDILRSVDAPHATDSRPDFLSKLGFGFFADRNPLDCPVFEPRS